jgi:hypothetical protein
MSARGPADAAASIEGLPPADFFAKPVAIDALLARIHDLIGG